MTPKEILERAANRIEPEDAWCWGAAARDKWGYAVHPTSSDATAWCIWGALYIESGEGGIPDETALAYLDALVAIAKLAPETYGGPDRFNDHHTQAECVALLRAAAESLPA